MKRLIFLVLSFFFVLVVNSCDTSTNGSISTTVNISGLNSYSNKYGQFALANLSTGYVVAATKMTKISSNGVFNSVLYDENESNWFGTGEYGIIFAVSSTNPGSDVLYAGIINSFSVTSDIINLNLSDFTVVNLNNNTFTKEGDVMVFYSESKGSSGGYSHQTTDYISGSGSMKVMVRAVTANCNEEFGIEYGNSGPGSLKMVNFYITLDGEYCIYWFDGSNSSSSYSWKKSSAINKTINSWNELRIDYSTTSKTFSFYINGKKVLDQNFTNIGEGYISYYTSLRYSSISEENPYRLEFKTTSPKVYPK